LLGEARVRSGRRPLPVPHPRMAHR